MFNNFAPPENAHLSASEIVSFLLESWLNFDDLVFRVWLTSFVSMAGVFLPGVLVFLVLVLVDGLVELVVVVVVLVVVVDVVEEEGGDFCSIVVVVQG